MPDHFDEEHGVLTDAKTQVAKDQSSGRLDALTISFTPRTGNNELAAICEYFSKILRKPNQHLPTLANDIVTKASERFESFTKWLAAHPNPANIVMVFSGEGGNSVAELVLPKNRVTPDTGTNPKHFQFMEQMKLGAVLKHHFAKNGVP